MYSSFSLIGFFTITINRGVTLSSNSPFLKNQNLSRRHTRNGRCRAIAGSLLLFLTGCNALPASGPTEAQFNRAQRDPQKNTVGYGIVQVSSDLITLLASETPPTPSSLDNEAPHNLNSDNDTVGPGDVLQVSVYEVGSSLFSSVASAGSMGGAVGGNVLPSTSTSSTLPPLNVDGNGNIDVPFAGQVHVAGMTTAQVGEAIQSRLRNKSQSPQVMVRIAFDIANSVMVYGSVKAPNRIPLTPNRERILDVIALAGGADYRAKSDEDYMVRLTRNDHIAELPLKTIETDPTQNVVMQADDRVQVTFQPRTFTVFGAAGTVTQTYFIKPTLTLGEAIAQVGGPEDARADPNAVYLFRFEDADVLQRLGMPVNKNAKTAPVVYQLDMMNPSSYFFAQRFMMRNRDIIYIANSSTNRFYKFFGLITTIVTPGTQMGGLGK